MPAAIEVKNKASARDQQRGAEVPAYSPAHEALLLCLRSFLSRPWFAFFSAVAGGRAGGRAGGQSLEW